MRGAVGVDTSWMDGLDRPLQQYNIPAMTITQDLLTESRFWSFWSKDWNKRISVRWDGTTPFRKVVKSVTDQFFKDTELAGWERQVTIKTPDIVFP